MALEKQNKGYVSHTQNHDKHAGHSPNIFKRKFWVSLFLTIPVLYFSPSIQTFLSFKSVEFSGSTYIPALLSLVILIYGGLVFLKSARAEIGIRTPGMMTLISMAISVSFLYSAAVTFGLVDGMDFWWELATLITIMLLGHWLEMASIDSAQGALGELAKLLPDTAERATKDGTKTVSVAELKVGDKVLVRPGASIPVDGEIIKGKSGIDESFITGESKLVEKDVGDKVVAGAINSEGSLTVQVTELGDDTVLSGIMKLVADAQNSKSKTQLLADSAAKYLFYYALIAALITAVSWAILGTSGLDYTIERVVAVLIIACPHALGLAIPLVTAISTTKAANSGILVRDRLALEQARKIDVVVFDKTGTLTKAEHGVVEVVAEDKKHAVSVAAGIEADSEHPLAKAITDYADEEKIRPKKATDFTSISGKGVSAKVDSKKYYIGGPQLLKERGVKLSGTFKEASNKAAKNAQSAVYLVEDTKVLAVFLIADVIREESKEAIRYLHSQGIKVGMLTGDSQAVADWVAKSVGIDTVHAEVLPGDKADIIKHIQSGGKRVAMVGDGVNDAPALTQADVGIAIGAGTDVAIESAGVVLARNDPRAVTSVIKLSKATYSKMVQNLIWATFYNLAAVPLAGGALAFTGFVLSPAVGAALMSGSTVIVALNAQLLRRINI
ncbi:TPA: heavy metal translocating P-type ATPase [Candidatus Saccharibacteria bacterium]|nr:heavy metal translocating P-type ATPase [Candidatus Saccharibacteria bacterium]HIO87603.1 heavy metal translocating P-type ATPase [Candidatus Saccharibacteria bacterium]